MCRSRSCCTRQAGAITYAKASQAPDDDSNTPIHEDPTIQDDMKWTLGEVHDMCEPPTAGLRHAMTQQDYFDEHTWERPNPEEVEKVERSKLDRFRKMRVHEYVDRQETLGSRG